MRTVSIWMLALALLISFSRAPFEHIHLDDPDHHHSHDGDQDGHFDPGEAAWEAPGHDLDAVYKDWLSGATEERSQAVAECGVALASPARLPASGIFAALRTRNHDPPAASQFAGRAPSPRSWLSFRARPRARRIPIFRFPC